MGHILISDLVRAVLILVILICFPQDGEEREASPPRVGDAHGENQPSSPHDQLCSEHPPLLIQGGRTLVILMMVMIKF